MTSRLIRAALVAGVAVASTGAFAGPTSEWSYVGEFDPARADTGLATTRFQDPDGLATRFEPASTAFTLESQTAAATSEGDRARASAMVLNTAPVVGTPAALDLTLWNFVFNIRAQQAGNPFTSLQTSSANIDYTLNGVPAPVPLPASSWLFLAGLAAFATFATTRKRSH